MSSSMLPEPLPNDPLPLLVSWFTEARAQRVQPNPDAMVLATVDADGSPAARVVLCKQLVSPEGYAVFFTNYESRKGGELMARPRAAAVLHWDTLHRQVRIEGPAVHSPTPESDAYFASRALESRISAWASAQSQPLASRAALIEQVRETAERFHVAPGATNGEVPRPPHWGGYRLWFDTVELWAEGSNRVHDRAVWKRTLQRKDAFSFTAAPWTGTRLNP
jgi:pyridoxamine 5'-phosphate oxidase